MEGEGEGRDGYGMVYGGVTMGKCFYCMLLAPPCRGALRSPRSAIFLRRFRASRSEAYSAVHIYSEEVVCNSCQWQLGSRKHATKN